MSQQRYAASATTDRRLTFSGGSAASFAFQPLEGPGEVAGHLADADGKVFVRPDSPLKPFSGRVVSLEGLKPADLDHGFYYDDLDLPVVVTTTQPLGAEYRFVIAQKVVATGCRYEADGRSAAGTEVPREVSDLTGVISSNFAAPDPVYILDLVEGERGLRMVEINPFSGADLYACDKTRIVLAVAATLGVE